MIVLFGIIGFLLACALEHYARVSRSYERELRHLRTLREEEVLFLDHLIRHFNLHVSDPYISRPNYNEKRCFHCNYPIGFNHGSDCLWVQMQPFVRKRYPQNPQKS